MFQAIRVWLGKWRLEKKKNFLNPEYKSLEGIKPTPRELELIKRLVKGGSPAAGSVVSSPDPIGWKVGEMELEGLGALGQDLKKGMGPKDSLQ